MRGGCHRPATNHTVSHKEGKKDKPNKGGKKEQRQDVVKEK